VVVIGGELTGVDRDALSSAANTSVPAVSATRALAVAVPADPALVSMLTVVLSPATNGPSVQVATEPAIEHAPCGELALLGVAPLTATVTVTPGASSGPMFVTVAVYCSGASDITGSGVATISMPRFVTPRDVSVVLEALFATTVSRSETSEMCAVGARVPTLSAVVSTSIVAVPAGAIAPSEHVIVATLTAQLPCDGVALAAPKPGPRSKITCAELDGPGPAFVAVAVNVIGA
jgi:hypothetical protein